jgi:hypothetical protein
VIADSPYLTGELALTPGGGALAGLVGGIVMVAAISVTQLHSPADTLRIIGRTLPGSAGFDARLLAVAGGAICGGLGALLGLLYAVCQQRAPSGGLMCAGLFYGAMLWIGGGLVSNLPFLAGVRALVRSRSWLLACCAYGLTLAIAASISESRRPLETAPTAQID